MPVLRWDHYQLETNNQAFSPRIAVSRYFPSAETVIHFSYDRVFQTPSFENILLSNSSEILSLDPTNFLRLPVEPSQGNYFEIGVSKSFWSKLKLDVNYYRRYVNNYADDDQISNTSISFPIAFRKSIIYGAEGKLYIPDWHGFSGLVSYSYMVGNAWYPVTGGLFLGDDASSATSQTTGHFPDFARPTQHRARPRPLSSPTALLAGLRCPVRFRASLRISGRPRGRSRSVRSRSHQPREFRSRPH